MAKLFYTLQEAADRLNKTPDEVMDMARNGQLQELQDKGETLFRRSAIDSLVKDEGSGSFSLESLDVGNEGSSLSLGGSGGLDDLGDLRLEDSSAGAPAPTSGTSGGDDLKLEDDALSLGDDLRLDDDLKLDDAPAAPVAASGADDSIGFDDLTDETRARFVADGGMQDVRKTVADVSKLVVQLSEVVKLQSTELTRTQDQLRRTLASVDSAKVDSTTRNIQATTASLEALTRELRTTNDQVQGLVTKVSNGTGTVGRMMNDPSVYARLDTLLLRADSLMADLKKNPRRYINLKVF